MNISISLTYNFLQSWEFVVPKSYVLSADGTRWPVTVAGAAPSSLRWPNEPVEVAEPLMLVPPKVRLPLVSITIADTVGPPPVAFMFNSLDVYP